MALAHAILVSLLDRPQTGYELGKRFDKTVGFFWKASHQQIYQELHKMAKAGWVQSETVAQSDKPNRIVYELTARGREALDAWVETPGDPPSVKEELLVKMFALGDVDTGTIVAELQRRRAYHVDRLAWYESVMAEHYPDPDRLTPRKRGRYLGLRLGIMSEKTTLAWCDEALALVGGASADDAPPKRSPGLPGGGPIQQVQPVPAKRTARPGQARATSSRRRRATRPPD